MQKKQQMNLKKSRKNFNRDFKKIDIIICTALIPGKKAPLIIKDRYV